MRILVTGGAGFIGSHLAEEGLRRGCDVRILDNFSTGKWENIESFRDDVEVFEGDIRDLPFLARAMRGVDIVFHEAALPSVPRSVADPITSIDVNVVGTVTVMKAAVDAGVRRVIYAASSSAYGNALEAAKHEALLPKPLSPYAVSKLAGEHLLQAFYNCYAIEAVGLRYFNVFGPRQDPHSQYSGVIAKFTKVMLGGERPTINGDGKTSRDFTYVSNVVAGNFLAATTPNTLNGLVMNLACGGNVTLLQLVEQLNVILGTRLDPLFAAERPGDVKHSCADIGRAQEFLGYRPVVDFAEGLQKTVAWYQSSL